MTKALAQSGLPSAVGGEAADPRDRYSLVEREGFIEVVKPAPDDWNDAAIALCQSPVGCRWLGIKLTGVEEVDLVRDHAVDAEDVLYRMLAT